MDLGMKSLKLHEEKKGKIETKCKVSIENTYDLSLAYTPGVAKPCEEIAKNEETAYRYTTKGTTVAVVTDGSAGLGLGNIGAKASLPVMEGKVALFKTFADVDAVPICIETQEVEEIVSIVKNISAPYGGINLEDISAPRCFDIEKRLQEELDIPVFHDDQHGTAIVTTAAVINSLKIVEKDVSESKIVINGAGAAGIAIAEMLLAIGVKDLTLCNRSGMISRDLPAKNEAIAQIAQKTNPSLQKGNLAKAMENADVFIGVSAPKTVTREMVASMNKDAVVFAMANPDPEIMPEDAFESRARIVGTGRSDYPNQINNVLVFPGLFKGALEVRAREITPGMKEAAAYALAGAVSETDRAANKVVPDLFDKGVVKKVSRAVGKAWENRDLLVEEVGQMEELEKAFDIRKTVFVAEQQVPLEYEFDEFDRLDGRCRHVIAYDKKKAVGTGRVRKTGKEAKIERICILPSYRRRGIGQRIVTQLETLIKQDEVQACQLHAQKYAEEFYRNLGYETVSEPFMEDGIEHVKMVKSIKTK